MKLHVLLIVGFALGVTGCGQKEQAAEEPVVEKKAYQNEAFMDHMHAHADQIDDLNAALADDDFDAILTPAYWLSRHETVSDIPADWQPYLIDMREAARAVESAPDLETARTAAKDITKQCQGCHAAAGIIAEGDELQGY